MELYDEELGPDEPYQTWLNELERGVIEGEFGYERGEFTVYPALWHGLYSRGLTPGQAWVHALKAVAASVKNQL